MVGLWLSLNVLSLDMCLEIGNDKYLGPGLSFVLVTSWDSEGAVAKRRDRIPTTNTNQAQARKGRDVRYEGNKDMKDKESGIYFLFGDYLYFLLPLSFHYIF